MKKGLMILCMAVWALSLMAIGLVRQQENKEPTSLKEPIVIDQVVKTDESRMISGLDNFALDVSTRFIATISKEDLGKAVSISDIIPKDAYWNRYSIVKTHVRIDNYGIETRVTGSDLNLNESQLALLKRVNYSDNLQFGAEHAASTESGSLNYMVSVVPEKQAEFIEGKDQLISYLRESSSPMLTLWQNNQWRAGKINFTVDKKGTVVDVSLTSTSGNPTIDQQMVHLITQTTNKWVPAENGKGEKVEQVLTFSFGSLGC